MTTSVNCWLWVWSLCRSFAEELDMMIIVCPFPTQKVQWACETSAPVSLPKWIWLQHSCSFPKWGFSQLPLVLPWEGAENKGRAPECQEEPSARGLGLAQSPDELFCHFVKLIVSIMPEQNNLNSAPTEHWQSSLTKKRSCRKKNRHWTTD